MKTITLSDDSVTVQLTEFELTALVAMVERAQLAMAPPEADAAGIRHAIHAIADEFRSLLGHLELTT